MGVAAANDEGSVAFLINAHEGLGMPGGVDGVDGGFDGARCGVFKAEGHGEAGGELAVDLGLGGAGADAGPANEVADILGGEGVKEFGGGWDF